MVGIVDYGVCNVGSIKNMLKKIGVDNVQVVSNGNDILDTDHLILPGVGSFDNGMASLANLGLVDSIKEYARSGRPLLGICLGMQLLGRKSEEGVSEGLSLIPMECKRFNFDGIADKIGTHKLKIPHMGWDVVAFSKGSELTSNISGQQRYYFVHSYHAVCDDRSYELMSCDYGYPFSAAVQNGKIFGVQFHPEKSHRFGMELLKNFVERC